MTAEKVTKKNSSKLKRKKYCSQPHRLISKRNPILYISCLTVCMKKKLSFLTGAL